MFAVSRRRELVGLDQGALLFLSHRNRLHRPGEQTPALDDLLVIQLALEIRRVVQLRLAVGIVEDWIVGGHVGFDAAQTYRAAHDLATKTTRESHPLRA